MQLSYGGNALPAITVSASGDYSQHGNTGTELICATDVALYQAKERGRNRVVPTGTPLDAAAS
jgi:GGDEF domain-containing protein